MSTKKYKFSQHDSGGRIIEFNIVHADDYRQAYVKAEKRAVEIVSHGVTLRNSRERTSDAVVLN